MHTRDAILPDADEIHDLIAAYSANGTLLPRSRSEIFENVRDFTVVEDRGQIIGCGALHLYGLHLAEIRSVAIHPSHQGKGAGRCLVRSLLDQAQKHSVGCVCLFTRIPEFFARMGFSVAAHEDLPEKAFKDCHSCPKLHCCDEVAMVHGALPKFALLPQSHSWFVKLD